MTLTRSTVLALAAGVSTLALATPAAAQTVLFSTGTTADGNTPAAGPLSGPLDVRGGITQIRTADGGLVSFVGDAAFTIGGATVRVSNGKFTARAGSAPIEVISPGGASAILPAGGSASFGVTANMLNGRALSGMLSIATASGTRRFAAGDSFKATGTQVSAAVTAGAQPVSAAPAALANSEARPALETENPQLPVFSAGTPAQVLAQALGRRNAPLGFDFNTVSEATADVNLAYLQAGGVPGGFSAGVAGGALQQYLSALRSGGAGTLPPALANAYLGYFSADGLAGLAPQQQAIIDAYARIVAAGGGTAFNDAAIGNAYSDYIRQLAAGAVETGLSPQAVAAYENYVRSLGLGDTYDAGRRAQIEAFEKLQAAGGSPSGAVGVDVIDRYLAYLATGAPAEAYTGASSALVATYLDYLKTVGFPAGTDPAAVERLLAFYAHLAAGGGIGTVPGGSTDPVVQPPVGPVLPTARYAGTLYGFAGGQTFSTDLPLVSVGIDADGYPRTFDGLNRIDTARLVEARKGERWVIGRYTDGKVSTTFSSGAREYTLSPNDSIHFGYATSVIPVTRTSGSARYALAASTTPSYFDGAAVTASSLTADLAIAFGAEAKFGIAGVLTTTAGGTAQRYAFESVGGLASPSLAIRRNNDMLQLNDGGTPVTSTDVRCFDNCSFSPNFVASGADADVVAGTYGIYANRTRGQILTGAAIFTPGDVTPQPGTDPQPEQPATKTTYAGAYLGRAGNASVGGGDSGAVEVETDAAGYPRSFRGYQRVGTARLVNEAKGEGWVVGRYTDGTFITTLQGTENTQTLSPTESLHFAFGTSYAPFTGNRGTARYAVAGFTTPTYDDGRVATSATLTGGIAVQFGSQIKYGIEATLTTTVAGDALRYTITSAGGLAAPSLGSQAVAKGFYLFGQAGVRSTDGSCADACRFSANMFGSGADGQVIAGTYSIRSINPVLTGGAVFTQNARDLNEAAPPVLTGAPTGSVDLAGEGAFASLNGSSVGTQAIAATNGKLEQIRQDKRGTNTDHDFGGLAGAIGWTRWSGGTTESTFASGANTTIPENGGQHMVWGTKATNLPTGGTASYTLAGSTKPTIADGSIEPGTLAGGALAVDFRSMRVGYDLSVQFGGSAYSLASRGGAAAPGVELLSDNRFESSFRNAEGPMISGNGCSGGNCYAEVRGFLAGPGASHAGLAYHFLSGPSGGIVSGAATFSKNP